MSLAALTWAFNQDLVPAQKVVLLALADYADDQGRCWPGQETLTLKTSLSVRGIRSQIRALEERGLVLTIERRKEGGARATNAYQLAFGLPAASAGSGAQPARHADDNRHAAAGIAEPSEEPSDTPPTPSFDEQFDELWKHWPNKNAKAAAKKKWRTAVAAYRKTPEFTAGQGQPLGDVVRKFGAAYRATTPPRFIPMLASWLNQERWTDPLPVDRTRGSYNPEPLAQSPIDDSPFDTTGALRIPKGMKPEYDDDGRFVRFVPLRGE